MTHAWLEKNAMLLLIGIIIMIAIGDTLAVASRVPLPVPSPALVAGAAE